MCMPEPPSERSIQAGRKIEVNYSSFDEESKENPTKQMMPQMIAVLLGPCTSKYNLAAAKPVVEMSASCSFCFALVCIGKERENS